ncbi:MAG: phosphoribosylanthranilate isomerase [Rhodospirillales bacterium]|nr:phosphoribosylanthranilate isomerase [Rhodospirillales bacterium]
MRTRVKVCCIASPAEAAMAIRLGADAVGLVGPMPSGPGVISLDLAAEIARSVPPPVASFLLSSATTVDGLVRHVDVCRPTALQIVDAVAAPAVYAGLREAFPWLKLVQVIHVTGPESVDEARTLASSVDAFLLDSGNPNLSVKELGGTGRVHDWATSARIVRAVRVPVFLAGGLRAENAVQAIRDVAPYGLDLCSGVRTDGALDETKLAAFMRAVRSA